MPTNASTQAYIDVPGGKIFVQRWDPASALRDDPLLLLHDSLGCVALWRDFPERLCRSLRRPVIAYDRLGFGRSSPRQALPSARFINEEAEVYLPALVSALNLDRFTLFGHSVGGGMALAAAGAFGARCEAVISESAQAFVEDRTREGILRAKRDFENPQIFAKLEKYHGERARWVLRAWTEIWLSREFETWKLEPELRRALCPLLVLHGDRDEYGSVRVPETIAELSGGPSELHILAGCGHVPHRENPDRVLVLVQDFLTRHQA